MAERVTRVRLEANIAGFAKAMEEAAKKTAAVGTEGEKLAQQREAFNQLGTAGLAMGTLLATGVGFAVKRFADFDAAMSSVQAATHETAGNMDLLRQAALDAGESTVFSATEAAGAIEELAKAGVSTADILGGGLAGSLDLAAAGELQVADAAGIAATALKQFNLQGDDMSHVADLLAAGAGKAMGDVSDLSQALNQAGLVANQTGLSIEETTAGLAAFAEQGLIGSDAGTSFKSMLQRMVPTSGEAAAKMKELGISAYDASGNFVGLAEFAGNLQGALRDLSPEQRNAAMATIFGSDAVRAAGVIYQQGEEGIRDWISAVDDQGYASKTASTRLDNLKGDIEALGGAFETALIDTGGAANDTLRTMAQALTGLIGMYNDLPAPVQAGILAVGGATAAVALSGGTALVAIPKWLQFKATVEASSLSMKGISLTAGIAGLALGGLFAVVGTLAAKHQQAEQMAQAYADALESGADAARNVAADAATAEQSFLWLSRGSAADAAEKLGLSLDLVGDAATGSSAALTEVNAAIEKAFGPANTKAAKDLTQQENEAAAAAQELKGFINEQTAAYENGTKKLEQKNAMTADSVEASGTAAESYIQEADAVADLNSELTDLIDRINEANGIAQDAVTTNARYQDALAGLSEQVESNGTSLDENTASGSANAAAMADLAGAAQTAAQAQLEQDLATMSADEAAIKYSGTLAAQKQAFIDSAVSAGYNADEVKALADRIFQMPTEKEFEAIVDTATAQANLDNWIYTNSGRQIRVQVIADGAAMQMGSYTVEPGMASGGPVYGPGPKGKDSELRMLAPGEHVLTAAEVDAAGGHGAIQKWRSEMMSGSPYALRSEPETRWAAAGPTYTAATPAPQIVYAGIQPGDSLSLVVNGQEFTAFVDTRAEGRVHAHDEAAQRTTRGGVRP
ncbi:phage tail tape measure protein [Microbacterium murale]|uniref:Phage tail tape measure protein n=1 Tax=Microbacterium murale TaxID=1081040 RepID=A0ABQ1RXD2_9MICO|nr:phage tail tape measure protein [Microbacterium murale]GGD83207.1 phage tail tape measure protein [Microbacterium murale]